MEAKDYVTAIRAAGLTQAQIADETGIPQPTISKIERGAVSDVMSRNYRALQALHARVVAGTFAQAAQAVHHSAQGSLL
jgi:transcriptional regulator with XRE-family HTH domain